MNAGLDIRRSAQFTNIQKGIKLRWLRIASLMISDALSVVVSWSVAGALATPSASWWNFSQNQYAFLPILCLTYAVFRARGLYKGGKSRRNYEAAFKASTLVVILLILLEFFYSPGQFMSRSHFIVFWLLSTSLTCSFRYALDKTAIQIRKQGKARYPVFLIANPDYQESSNRIISDTGSYNVISTADASVLDLNNRDGTFAELRNMNITEVFIHWEAIKNRLFLCQRFQAEGMTTYILFADQDIYIWDPEISTIGNTPAIAFHPPVLSGLDFWLKRIFDLISAITILILASPVYLLIALLIAIDSPGAVFYRQTRIGLRGNPFKVWKFRTMLPNADQLQKELEARNESKDGVLFKIKDDPRITRVGKFLRQYSLDELPQIFNVIVGEMSLVGPRPFPVRDVEKFSRHHHIRQEVLPGITGLWQISGRSDIVDFEQAYKLDLSYIQNWSLWLDIKILLKTVGVVLGKSGAY